MNSPTRTSQLSASLFLGEQRKSEKSPPKINVFTPHGKIELER